MNPLALGFSGTPGRVRAQEVEQNHPHASHDGSDLKTTNTLGCLTLHLAVFIVNSDIHRERRGAHPESPAPVPRQGGNARAYDVPEATANTSGGGNI